MSRLKDKYMQEILPKLQGDLDIKNKLAVPRVTKIVISVGLGEAKDDKGVLDKVSEVLRLITGQAPVVTLAKKSVAFFKLSQGAPIGLLVTLRRERMYSFLDKLFNIVLPKLRDFRGVSDTSFDKFGNFNLGLPEQAIFSEVSYKLIDKTRGLAVTIVTSAKQKDQGKRLLEYLGMPFRKG